MFLKDNCVWVQLTFVYFIWLVYIYRYTTVGREILPQIKSGDVIRSAKLVEGEDNLVLPDDS